MTDPAASLQRSLRADRFHTGVRLAAMILWFVTIVVVFYVLRLLAQVVLGAVTGIGIVLLIVLAVLLAQPLAWWVEQQLITRWPSGRAVQLEPGALHWRDRGPAARIDLGQMVNFWRWRFAVRRRRGGRVPSGHTCFAIRLAQGDHDFSLYSFFPPASAEALGARYAFYELRRANDETKIALGGRDAIYLAAEHSRWDTGAELDPADFEALLAHLAAHLPEFGKAPASSL